MSIFNDEEIINNVDNYLLKKKIESLSYGFFAKKILYPEIKNIKKGCSDLKIYLSHPEINKFKEFCEKICTTKNITVNFLDCSTPNINSLPLFIHKLSTKSINIIANPSLIYDEEIKEFILTLWKGETGIKEFFNNKKFKPKILELDNLDNWDNLDINNTNTNHPIIYVDDENNEDFNLTISSGIKCYGEFMIAKKNYMFIEKYSEKSNPNIRKLIDFGNECL